MTQVIQQTTKAVVVQQATKAFLAPGKPLQARAGIPGPSGKDAALSQRELLTIATNGQTVFTLSAVPALPHLSQLYLNGSKATHGLHYTINSAVLTWLTTPALAPSDDLEIYY